MSRPVPPVAVVVGWVVRYPLAGMAWSFLSYLLALRDLGYEPVFMEAAIESESCYDVDAAALTGDPAYGIRFLESCLAATGLGGIRWWYRDGDRDWGMSRDEAVAVLEESAVLLNVAISSWCPEFRRAPRRLLVDCDAPLTQIQLERARYPLTPIVDAHDTLFTYAVNLAEGGYRGPDGGRRWRATRPPVHLPSWTTSAPSEDGAWTTVTSWREKGRSYRAILDLPSRGAGPFELAIAGDAPAGELRAAGWRVVDPVPVTRSLPAFADYVRGSRGEVGVAKHAFVESRSGAFNDRALAYLASGRPVVCSDTGLSWLPAGDGLLPFRDALAAARAIATVEEDRVHHGRAARALAEDHFAGGRVVGRLLRDADVPLPEPVAAGGAR